MARSRNIKPGFFKNEQLAEIEPLGRLLFAGLWCLADRKGRLEDRPKRIKAEILPYDDCDVDALLWVLHDKNFIVRYRVGNNRYIQVVNFLKHQHPHINENPSIIPAPDSIGAIREDSGTSTVQAPEDSGTTPSDSLILDPLIPDPDPSIEGSSARSKDTATEEGSGEETTRSAPDGARRTLSEPNDPAQQIMDEYNRLFQACWKRPLRLTPERRAKIRARLKTFSPVDLFTAMANIRASPFHCGENDKGQVYATPEFIFRNDAMVDKWLATRKPAERVLDAYEDPSENLERKRQQLGIMQGG